MLQQSYSKLSFNVPKQALPTYLLFFNHVKAFTMHNYFFYYTPSVCLLFQQQIAFIDNYFLKNKLFLSCRIHYKTYLCIIKSYYSTMRKLLRLSIDSVTVSLFLKYLQEVHTTLVCFHQVCLIFCHSRQVSVKVARKPQLVLTPLQHACFPQICSNNGQYTLA